MAKKIDEKFETYFLDIIEERVDGTWPSTLRFLLRQLSRVFTGVASLRVYMYRKGFLRNHTLGCQVVSVGNLTVGGTGKTPVVEIFARELTRNGRKVAILSRGYKREKRPFKERLRDKLLFKNKKSPPRIVSNGERLLLDSARSGDEPYMLATNLRSVPVIVGSDRARSGKWAIRKYGCDTLILDDGFQHLQLQQHVRVVLVDRQNPFGNGYTLPRGTLREPVHQIKRADYIFITKSDEQGAPELQRYLRSLNPSAEITECRHAPRYLKELRDDTVEGLELLDGMHVVAVSGIARPRGFEQGLTRLGARVLFHQTYADHHRYSQQEIIDVINKAVEEGADAIITTEKDAVRFPRLDHWDLPVYFLRVEIEMLSGEENFNEWISRICFDG